MTAKISVTMGVASHLRRKQDVPALRNISQFTLNTELSPEHQPLQSSLQLSLKTKLEEGTTN
jgi:hypothetical protein